jgi:hypothetical protein
MTGVLVDWGPNINPVYTNETSGDPGFIKHLAAESGSTAGIGGVLAQYMDSSGHNAANQVSYGQQFQIAPSVASTTISDSQITSELTSQIQAGHLPHPSGNGLQTIYLVLFPAGDTECMDAQNCSANSPNQAAATLCAYHGGTQLPDGTNLLYAVIPDNTSGPMSSECGNAPSTFGDQTSYLSHEWAEAISDPLGNAWWVNNSSSSSYGNEIGDNCNQLMGSDSGWTVQLEWSNRAGNCVGSEPAYQAPTASFVANNVALPGQPVSFDASSSSDPSANTTAVSGTSYAINSGLTNYRWNWGDGTSSVSATPQANHGYAATGNYQVSLSVTDNLGFTSTVTRGLSVTSDGTLPPAATTGSTTAVSDTAATLEGTVNPENQAVQYRFAYGSSASSLSQSTPLTAGPAGAVTTPISATLLGLSPSTTYYYRLDVISGAQTYSGSVQSFNTSATPTPTTTQPPAPTTQTSPPPTHTPPPSTPTRPPITIPRLPRPNATTGPVTRISGTGATVSGFVGPNGHATSYHVEFGSTTAYGHSTPASPAGAGSSTLAVTATLAGLRPRTIYHYRLVATSAGGTSVGSDLTFRTSRALSQAPRFSFAVPSRAALRAALRGRLKVHFRCSQACSAHFVVTVSSARVTRFAPVAVTLARGVGRIASQGSGSASIRFIPAARSRLNQRTAIRLIVFGYASSSGSSRSAPRAERLTLS